jgi:hypothetical protein
MKEIDFPILSSIVSLCVIPHSKIRPKARLAVRFLSAQMLKQQSMTQHFSIAIHTRMGVFLGMGALSVLIAELLFFSAAAERVAGLISMVNSFNWAILRMGIGH